MQELEKILEEIDREEKNDLLSIGHTTGYKAGALKMANTIKDIIHKHMNDNNSCGECSRRKWYQIGYKDGKDDGWISAEERMPEEYGEYLVTIVPSAGYLWAKRIIANFSDLMGIVKKPIFYTGEVGKIDFEDITDMVIAWRPLPEPYIPRNQNKPEEHYPDWRAKLLNKFDRRE